MKIIFLDIDGVLINLASFRLPDSGSGTHVKAHPDCVAALNQITDATGAHLVVSSVWRVCGISRMRDILSGWGVTGKLLGCTPDLCHQKDTAQIIEGAERGDEIQRWLDEYERSRSAVEAFVILDDATDMKHLLDRLVQTEFKHGLTPDHALRAIEMLGGENHA